MKKILIFKIGALGDVLMTTPFVRELRKINSNSRITYLVGKSFKTVLNNNPHIDYILTFDESIFFKKKLISILRLIHFIRQKHFDEIYVLDKHWIFSLFAFLTGIKKRIGFKRDFISKYFLTKYVVYGPLKHEIDYYLSLINKENIKNKSLIFILSKKDLAFANKIWKNYSLKNKKVISIAIGGGNNTGQKFQGKIWPLNNYIKLIQKLVQKNFIVILIGGKTDIDLAKTITNTVKNNLLNFVGKVSIQSSAALIKKSNLFICNDSGPMHIASAVMNNIIAIFGPTDPRRLAPLNSKTIYLWKQKEPCYDIFGNFYKCKGNEIEKVTVNDVLNCVIF